MGKRATIYVLDARDDIYHLVEKINANFRALGQDTTVVQSSMVDIVKPMHNELDGRLRTPKCHDMESIEGLLTELAKKASKDTMPDSYLLTTYPLNKVYPTTEDDVPQHFKEIMEWEKIGSIEVDDTTVNLFERTK